MDIQEFKQFPLLGILRGITGDMISPIATIANQTNLKALEITMNTPKAPLLIQKLSLLSHKKFAVGAGTVLTIDEVKTAIDAGATFIVSPNVNFKIIEYCVTRAIPVFPGALTPTEIHLAWQAGASMVKVFPASMFGPKYFKELKGPFDSLELLACGGISNSTIAEYFKNGAAAVAFGASIFDLQKLHNEKYNDILIALQELINAYKSVA